MNKFENWAALLIGWQRNDVTKSFSMISIEN